MQREGGNIVTKLLAWQVREITGIQPDQLTYGLVRGYIQAAPETFRHMHLFTVDQAAQIAVATLFLPTYRVAAAWDKAAEGMRDPAVRLEALAYIARRMVGEGVIGDLKWGSAVQAWLAAGSTYPQAEGA